MVYHVVLVEDTVLTSLLTAVHYLGICSILIICRVTSILIAIEFTHYLIPVDDTVHCRVEINVAIL